METVDRDATYFELFRKKQREYLRTVIDAELLEEHRKNPRGQHSEPLERLLHYFRTAPQKDKYVIRRDVKSGKYRIAQLTGDKDVPTREVGSIEYKTLREVYHEIFLRRVRELLEADA
jgi:branched-chain amino acid transport system permease protein